MTNGEIEAKLREAMDGAVAKGWVIVTGSFGSLPQGHVRGSCCALGALALSVQAPLSRGDQATVQMFDLPYTWTNAFMAGFDGSFQPAEYPDAYEMGRRLRRDYIPGKP